MKPTRFAVIAAAGVLSLSLVAPGAIAGSNQGQEPLPTVLRTASVSFPDSLDPQLSYTPEGWMALYDTYIPLLTHKHADGKPGSKVVPGLAGSLPRITNGGRTYTLFLRRGLRYSSGRPVKAADFEFAIERLFRINSPGAYYYADIVGVRKFRKKKRSSISGIATDNRSGRITIRLTRRQGTFSSRLALLFAAPLPPNTPIKTQTRNPPPATGQYVIVSSRPGHGWEYARNPAWGDGNERLMPHLPSGSVDRISVTVFNNWSALVKEVEWGGIDWSLSSPEANFPHPNRSCRPVCPGTASSTSIPTT